MKTNINPNSASNTQCQKILELLQNGGSITTLEALNKFGCFRLASRINDLTKQGYVFDRQWETNAQTGKRYVRYRLVST